MQLSEKGRKQIELSEGLRLIAYKDTGGVWTIGYGHTNGVKPGQVITEAIADQLFSIDIQSSVDTVNRFGGKCTQGQFDALVDFVFNLGAARFLGSTLRRKHLAGDYKGALNEFPKWKYDNGKVIKGLVERRKREVELYAS